MFDNGPVNCDNMEDADNEGEEERRSPFIRMKSKVRRKMDDLADDISREIKEEWQDSKQIRKAENVANDLVDPDTLDRLKEIILEKPEIEAGCDYKLWYHIISKSVTYVLLKLVDIFTDFAAAQLQPSLLLASAQSLWPQAPCCQQSSCLHLPS